MRARFSADLDNFNISSDKWVVDFSRAARVSVAFCKSAGLLARRRSRTAVCMPPIDAFASTASRAIVCCPAMRASRSRIAALDRIWTITIVATSRTPRPEAMPSLAPIERFRRKRVMLDMIGVLEKPQGQLNRSYAVVSRAAGSRLKNAGPDNRTSRFVADEGLLRRLRHRAALMPLRFHTMVNQGLSGDTWGNRSTTVSPLASPLLRLTIRILTCRRQGLLRRFAKQLSIECCELAHVPKTVHECDRLDRLQRRTPQQLLTHTPQPPQPHITMHAHPANRDHGVMQRPNRDPELPCHVGAVQRLAGVDGDVLVEFPDQRQIVAQAQALGFGRRRRRSHRQIGRLQYRFFDTLDRIRLNESIARMRREHQDVAQDSPKGFELGGFRCCQLWAVEFARQGAIGDGIEIHEGNEIGLLLDD